MATINTGSRYDATPGSSLSGNAVDNNVVSNGTSKSTEGQSSTTNSTGTQTTQSNTTNMDPQSLAALHTLINQLLTGGTAAQKAQQAQRTGEISTVQGLRSGYSKASAFTDASGLMAQQMRRALESAMPGISRAAEDAGSSGGALRALLLQDASDKAAESSAALGAKQATDYGNISANFSQVLEHLTQADPTVTNALINALGAAKGAVTSTTSTTTEDKTGTTDTTGTKATSENKTQNTDYAPFGTNTAPTTAANSGVMGVPSLTGDYLFSSPYANPKALVGSTLDNMLQLHAAGGDAWSGYSF